MEGSHDYKATVAAFESFPRDELFQAPVDALRGRDRGGRARRGGSARHADRAARLRQPQRHGHGRDAGRPHVHRAPSCACRRCSLQRYHAESVEYHLALVEDAAAQLFFLLHVPAGGDPDVPLRRARAGGRPARAHVGRPAARRAGRALRRSRGPAPRDAVRGAAARLLQDRDPARPRARATSCCWSASRTDESFAVGLQNELATHTQVGARPLTRVGRRNASAARSRSASCSRCSRRSA